MSDELEDLLQTTAAVPEHVPDPRLLVRRGRRRRHLRRAAIGAGALIALTVVLTTAIWRSDPDELDVANESPTTIEPTQRERISELEQRSSDVVAEADQARARLAQNRAERSQLEAKRAAGEDVDDALAEVNAMIAAGESALSQLERSQLAVERQLADLDALDDPQALARVAATESDRTLAMSFRQFAATPGPMTVQDVPFATKVRLGLGRELGTAVDAGRLLEPKTWELDADGFRARTGVISALELVRQAGAVQVLAGSYPRCSSPSDPPPSGFDTDRRVSIQPYDYTSCLDWWAVDLFLGADDEVVAVTVDVFEP